MRVSSETCRAVCRNIIKLCIVATCWAITDDDDDDDDDDDNNNNNNNNNNNFSREYWAMCGPKSSGRTGVPDYRGITVILKL